jgi:hypothetical protein
LSSANGDLAFGGGKWHRDFAEKEGFGMLNAGEKGK